MAGIGALWKMLLGIIFVVLVTVLRRGIWGGAMLFVPCCRGAASASSLPRALAGRDRACRGGSSRVSAPPSTVRSSSRHAGSASAMTVLTAVDDVSFDLAEGEIRAVIGPNGAGKTTFFNMLAGTVPPSDGDILFRGEQHHRARQHARLPARHRQELPDQSALSPASPCGRMSLIPTLARRYGKFQPSMLRRVATMTELNDLVAATARGRAVRPGAPMRR